MQHLKAIPAQPVRSSLRKHSSVALAVLVLAACGDGTTANRRNVNQLMSEPAANTQATVAETSAIPVPTPEPAPSFPRPVSNDELRPLLEAIALGYPFTRQLESKEASGRVEALETARIDENLDQALRDLEGIRRNLRALSRGGLPTYALIHNVRSDGILRAWIVAPDGSVVAGATTSPYAGLGALQGGLGVDRIAATRGPQLKGEEKPRLDADAERGAGGRDGSPEAIRKRHEVLTEAAEMLLPGDIRQVLAAGEGRLLVLPVRDTGTAPYAALPIRNQDDFAARRWSFVVMQDLSVLAGSDSAFDMSSVDLSKSVIVGDPADMRDVQYSFPALPGARKEAIAIAKLLHVDSQNVFIGADATQKNVEAAINRSGGQGVVYMATHAMAHPNNPLTRGFVVLEKKNWFAGEIRAANFKGWDAHPPLVVMSACQSALGRVFEGGTFGVARTWTTAGAGQVVASLWNVSDNATYRLMTRFAAALEEGKAPELAMQAAQLRTIKEYPDDPKMWASFTIIGKPTIGSSLEGSAAVPITEREPAAG